MKQNQFGFKALGLAFALCCVSVTAAEKPATIGVVDFAKCIHDSKVGKKEQEQFESIKNQMQKAIEDLHAQLTDTDKQLQNPDLLDSLSPEAEKELKGKLQVLSEEFNRYQNQYSQVLQQAQMRLIHSVAEEINKASEFVAKRDKISLVINKEAAFYVSSLDITDSVIVEMDKKFDKETKLPMTQNKDGSKNEKK